MTVRQVTAAHGSTGSGQHALSGSVCGEKRIQTEFYR